MKYQNKFYFSILITNIDDKKLRFKGCLKKTAFKNYTYSGKQTPNSKNGYVKTHTKGDGQSLW